MSVVRAKRYDLLCPRCQQPLTYRYTRRNAWGAAPIDPGRSHYQCPACERWYYDATPEEARSER